MNLSTLLKGLILLSIALLIRLYFFIPVQGSDDIGYNKAAYEMAMGVYQLTPHEFYLRYGLIIPMSLSIKLFGLNLFGSTFYLIVCSLAFIVLAFLIGKTLFNEAVGWWSAILLSCFPLNIFSATDIHSDMPMSLFLGVAFYMLILADRSPEKKQQIILALIAGVCGGIAYTAKIPAAALFPAYIGCYSLITRRWNRTVIIPSMLSFGVVLGIETLYYIIESGDPLYHIHAILQHDHMAGLMRQFPDRMTSVIHILTNYPNMMFNFLSFDNTYFGGHYYVALGGLILFLRQQKQTWYVHPLMVYTISIFAILNFAPGNWETWAPAQTHVPRTFSPMTIPCVIWGGVLINHLSRRRQSIILAVLIVITCIHLTLLKADAGYTAANIRNAYQQFIAPMQDTNPQIVADVRNTSILTYLSGYHLQAVPYENVRDFKNLEDRYVLVDYSRLAFLKTFQNYQIDQTLTRPPPTWVPVFTTVPTRRVSIRQSWAQGKYWVNPFSTEPDTSQPLIIYKTP